MNTNRNLIAQRNRFYIYTIPTISLPIIFNNKFVSNYYCNRITPLSAYKTLVKTFSTKDSLYSFNVENQTFSIYGNEFYLFNNGNYRFLYGYDVNGSSRVPNVIFIDKYYYSLLNGNIKSNTSLKFAKKVLDYLINAATIQNIKIEFVEPKYLLNKGLSNFPKFKTIKEKKEFDTMLKNDFKIFFENKCIV